MSYRYGSFKFICLALLAFVLASSCKKKEGHHQGAHASMEHTELGQEAPREAIPTPQEALNPVAPPVTLPNPVGPPLNQPPPPSAEIPRTEPSSSSSSTSTVIATVPPPVTAPAPVTTPSPTGIACNASQVLANGTCYASYSAITSKLDCYYANGVFVNNICYANFAAISSASDCTAASGYYLGSSVQYSSSLGLKSTPTVSPLPSSVVSAAIASLNF